MVIALCIVEFFIAIVIRCMRINYFQVVVSASANRFREHIVMRVNCVPGIADANADPPLAGRGGEDGSMHLLWLIFQYEFFEFDCDEMSLRCNYHCETIGLVWIMARKAGTPNGCSQMIMR